MRFLRVGAPLPPISPDAGRIRLGQPRGRWIIAATVLGSSMAMLDATAVNVALPTIGKELNTSLAGLQWVVTAYTLTLAGLILLGGALGDRFGRRRVFLIGVTWFALSSALCGLAPNIDVLIAARALQGIGGALLTPGSLAIIQSTFAADDRPRAIGAWSGLGGVAGAIGPFLGGWIVGSIGWRWIFLINLPLAVAVLAVTSRHVPESRDPTAQGRFDIAGAVLAALALAGITDGLIEAPSGSLLESVVPALAGVAAGVAFVLLERRRGRHPERIPPMLPLGIFSSRQFTAINLITFVVYGAMGAVFFLLVLDLQVVAGFTPLQAGISLLPSTVALLLLSSRAGALAQRFGPRWLMTGGLLLAAAGLALLTRIGPAYVVRGRRAAGRAAVRDRPVHDRGPAHRHRAGQRGRAARGGGERGQQRHGPGGRAAGRGGPAGRGRAQWRRAAHDPVAEPRVPRGHAHLLGPAGPGRGWDRRSWSTTTCSGPRPGSRWPNRSA